MENWEKPTKRLIHSSYLAMSKEWTLVSDNTSNTRVTPSCFLVHAWTCIIPTFCSIKPWYFLQQIFAYRFNQRQYDTNGLIIDAKWMTKFEKFTQEDVAHCHHSGDSRNYLWKCLNLAKLIQTRKRSRKGQTAAEPPARQSHTQTPAVTIMTLGSYMLPETFSSGGWG